LRAQHVSSGIPLVIRSSNCICSLWFTYACGDRLYSSLSGNSFPLRLEYGQSPHAYVDQRLQIQLSSQWWAVCRSKHVEPSMNGGIINSVARLHLVGYFYWVILRCTDPWILYFTAS